MGTWDTVAAWPAEEVRAVPVELLGEAYRRYRLPDRAGEEAMMRSLQRYGQLAPLVVCRRQEQLQVLDGFKRLVAARSAPAMKTLLARCVAVDERLAKAAIYGLNQVGRHTCELEEAWIVQALVRQDGLTQVEVAELLGRHKSWVCRRLALLEKLAPEIVNELRVGLLSQTVARQLVRLPAGNQGEVLTVLRQEALTAEELKGVVDLLLSCPGRDQEQFILEHPRQALQRAGHVRVHDPRLSVAGNRLARRLAQSLEVLRSLENWLHYPGLSELKSTDRDLLLPSLHDAAEHLQATAQLLNETLSLRSIYERTDTQ